MEALNEISEGAIGGVTESLPGLTRSSCSTLKSRLIPVVLLRDGHIVQSKGFKRYQVLGNPTAIVQRLGDWTADELIYLDISRSSEPGSPTGILEILGDVSKACFMPLTFGGGVRTVQDIELRLKAGADKVTVNTQALAEPDLITQAAREFGSQAVVVSIDALALAHGGWLVCSHGGRSATEWSPASWAREAERLGAGEILINSIDRDGSGQGYDLELVRSIAEAVSIPVIACGGVGNWEHLAEGIQAGAAAVAAANIFHYTENSVFRAKRHLLESGLPVRPPDFGERMTEGVKSP